MSELWNPWHGCTKVSIGCKHCYVYRRDAEFGKDASIVHKTSNFNLPLKKNRQGQYKLQPEDGYVMTCFTSDFFHKDADPWRAEAWAMMKTRSDLQFYFVTKRPERFSVKLPDDWGDGYSNVHIVCTCENQYEADKRLAFHFHQTGYNFRRGERIFHIDRKDQHDQAKKANIDYNP